MAAGTTHGFNCAFRRNPSRYDEVLKLVEPHDNIFIKRSRGDLQAAEITDVDLVYRQVTVQWTESYGEVQKSLSLSLRKVLSDNFDLYRVKFQRKTFGEIKRFDDLMIRYLNSFEQWPRGMPTLMKQTNVEVAAARASVQTTKKAESNEGFVADCPICLVSLKGRKMVSSACGHVYCYDCLMQWLTIKNTCALCKLPVGRVRKIFFS